jgi:hypothetical protein
MDVCSSPLAMYRQGRRRGDHRLLGSEDVYLFGTYFTTLNQVLLCFFSHPTCPLRAAHWWATTAYTLLSRQRFTQSPTWSSSYPYGYYFGTIQLKRIPHKALRGARNLVGPIVTWICILTWRWRLRVPPIRCNVSTRMHGDIPQRTVIFKRRFKWRFKLHLNDLYIGWNVAVLPEFLYAELACCNMFQRLIARENVTQDSTRSQPAQGRLSSPLYKAGMLQF